MATYVYRPLGEEKMVKTGHGYVPEGVLTGLRVPSYEYAQQRRARNRLNRRKSVMNGDAFKPGGHLYHLTSAYAEEKAAAEKEAVEKVAKAERKSK